MASDEYVPCGQEDRMLSVSSRESSPSASSDERLEIERRHLDLLQQSIALSQEKYLAERERNISGRFLEIAKESLDIQRHFLAAQHDGLEKQQQLHKNIVDQFLAAQHYSREKEQQFQKSVVDNILAGIWGLEVSRGQLTRKDVIQSIIVPLVVVLVTAVFGTWLAVHLQNRSFRRNELFKARLDQVVRQRQEAVTLLQEVEEAWRQVRADERLVAQSIRLAAVQGKDEETLIRTHYCSPQSKKSAGVEALRRIYGRMLAMGELFDALGHDNPVKKSHSEFMGRLQAFLQCAQTEGCPECAEKHAGIREPLRDLIGAYSKVENQLITSAEQ